MKRIISYLFLANFLFLSCVKQHDNSVENDMSAVRGYKNWYIDNFRCGLFVPPSYDINKKYPLIIYLHGYSDTTTWNLEWYNDPIVSGDPCIVLTPKCPKEEAYGWGNSFNPGISPIMAKTFEMVERVKQSFNLDLNRFYVYGISMGGYGTYGVIQKNPDMFAAAYAECGEPNITIAPIIAKIPFWIFHGSDDPVVPVQPDRNLYKAVLDIGGTQIRYTEYPGVGHNVWDYAGKETTLTSWLLAQSKGSLHQAPDGINTFTVDLSAEKKVYLKWDLPSGAGVTPDNKIWYCKVYRNDIVINEVYNDKNSFIDSTVTETSTYKYKISAVNFYFRESVPSGSVSITIGKE
jgi:hypothetical protein